MTKQSRGSKRGLDRTIGDRGTPPAQRDGGCDHDALVDGTQVTLLLDGGRDLHWRHHDSDRLSRIHELLRGRCLACSGWHALRVGPSWFNCAAETDLWQECRVSRALSHA